MADEQKPSGLVLWRLDELRDQVKALDLEKADRQTVEDLKKDFASLRTALYAMAGSVLVAAVIFALAVFQLTGKG